MIYYGSGGRGRGRKKQRVKRRKFFLQLTWVLIWRRKLCVCAKLSCLDDRGGGKGELNNPGVPCDKA